MSFVLRDYQQDLIDRSRQGILDGSRSILIVAPTGAGKTALAAHILGTSAKRGKRSWFIVHRRELITQSSRTFERTGIKHNIVANGFTQTANEHTSICSIQTLARRLDGITQPDIIVWDECHHIASESWSKIFSTFADCIHIGLTATPCRLDGRGLGDWFDKLVEGPTTKSLIEGGHLTPFKYFAPCRPDVSNVATRAGDFATADLAQAMDKPTITGDAILHYERLCAGKNAIVFATNIDHSKHIVSQFQNRGHQAAHLDGSMPREQRDAIVKKFERGEIRVLSNVDLFGEGFDVPAIDCAILLRPTQSTSLFLQQVGRALRTHPGKTHATILDHAGNVFRHGLPDEIREWSLNSVSRNAKERKSDRSNILQCERCYATFTTEEKFCPVCGFVRQVQQREINAVAGELTEIINLSIVKKREQGSAQTLDQLISLATARKYKNPRAWAQHVLKARMAKKWQRNSTMLP
jgi:DNA repair protein RadD